jgi:hypothetical protein
MSGAILRGAFDWRKVVRWLRIVLNGRWPRSDRQKSGVPRVAQVPTYDKGAPSPDSRRWETTDFDPRSFGSSVTGDWLYAYDTLNRLAAFHLSR